MLRPDLGLHTAWSSHLTCLLIGVEITAHVMRATYGVRLSLIFDFIYLGHLTIIKVKSLSQLLLGNPCLLLRGFVLLLEVSTDLLIGFFNFLSQYLLHRRRVLFRDPFRLN